MREPSELEPVGVNEVRHRGQRLVYFGGADYLRFSWHPEVRTAVTRTVETDGPSACASRLTTGNRTIYADLERALRRFFGFESATLTSSGYAAPLVAAQALAPDHTHVLVAEGAHACLQDAATLTRLPVTRFPASDPDALRAAMRRCGRNRRVLVLTDGMSAVAGTVPPLADYAAAMPSDCTLLVDDAHGAGVLGRRGRGSLEHCGVRSDRIVLTVTFSKALGVYGGAVLGAREVRQKIFERSALFTGNTVLPPPWAAGALAALELLRREGRVRRARLWENAARLRHTLAQAGVTAVNEGPGPVVPLALADTVGMECLCRRLRAAGIHPPLIRYPNGPAERFLRFAVSSEHTAAELAAVCEVVQDFLRRA